MKLLLPLIIAIAALAAEVKTPNVDTTVQLSKASPAGVSDHMVLQPAQEKSAVEKSAVKARRCKGDNCLKDAPKHP